MTGDEVSLRDYLVARIEAAEMHLLGLIAAHSDRYKIELENAKERVSLAAQTVDNRLEGMNELRSQLFKERGAFVPRELHDQLEQQMSERISAMERWQNKIMGALGFLALFIPLLLGLMLYFANRH